MGTERGPEDWRPQQIKTGKEYLELLEKTAARVEKWPQWKLGERSFREIDKKHYHTFDDSEVGDCAKS